MSLVLRTRFLDRVYEIEDATSESGDENRAERAGSQHVVPRQYLSVQGTQPPDGVDPLVHREKSGAVALLSAHGLRRCHR